MGFGYVADAYPSAINFWQEIQQNYSHAGSKYNQQTGETPVAITKYKTQKVAQCQQVFWTLVVFPQQVDFR